MTTCVSLVSSSDQVYQLLSHGRWFSSGIPASSTTKIGRHDIAEILLKVALKHQKINQSNLSLAWIILKVFAFKIMSDYPDSQPAWQSLNYIENEIVSGKLH